MKCTLEHDINNCPFFDLESFGCQREGKCSFQEKENGYVKNPYIRKERWYDKYYKRKK